MNILNTANPRPFFLVVLGASLLTNALLVHQNRAYRNQISRLVARQGLQKGALLRTINGYDLSGSPVTFDFSRIQRSTVLFVVSAVCGECTRSWPAWKTIVESLRGGR